MTTTLKRIVSDHNSHSGNLRPLLLVVACFLIVLVFFMPFAKKFGVQTKEIASIKKQITAHRSLVKRQAEFSENFSVLSKKIQAKLPSSREESQFLTEVGNVAKDTNVHIASTNILPIREIGSFRELSVEIDMEANLGNLVRFLYYMRKSSVALVANTLSLQPKSERSALLQGNLIISTIYLNK